MRSSVDTTEVQRLIYDISTCTVEWEEPPGVTVPLQARGLEFFPCFALNFQRHPMEIKGIINPGSQAPAWEPPYLPSSRLAK